MSMLYYFFSIKGSSNHYLFDHLKIKQNEKMMRLQNQFPVIFLTLKDIDGSNYDSCIESYRILMSNLHKNFNALIYSSFFDSTDKEIYNPWSTLY